MKGTIVFKPVPLKENEIYVSLIDTPKNRKEGDFVQVTHVWEGEVGYEYINANKKKNFALAFQRRFDRTVRLATEEEKKLILQKIYNIKARPIT